MQGRLDSESEVILHHRVAAAHRLEAVIKDLLEYTRPASDSPANPPTVRLNEVLDNPLAALAAEIRDSDAQVLLMLCRFNDPCCYGKQIFQQIIENAVKYRSKEAPRIHVGAVRNGGSWTFSVADNGIGISSGV